MATQHPRRYGSRLDVGNYSMMVGLNDGTSSALA